jgi:hypothetical protein
LPGMLRIAALGQARHKLDQGKLCAFASQHIDDKCNLHSYII